MIYISLPWDAFHKKYGEAPLSFYEARGNYYIYMFGPDREVGCVVDCNSKDGAEFKDKYLPSATEI